MTTRSVVNLVTAFAASAAAVPDKTALFWGEREISYRQLRDQTGWVAHALAGQFKVRPGDRVGLWLRNRPEFIPALLGVLAAGGVVVPINNFLKPEEVAYILQDAGADVLITEEATANSLATLHAHRPGLRVLQAENFDQQASFPPTLQDRTESDLAVLIYTSGTTGHPKGAMLTHGNLLHNVASCRAVLDVVNLDRFALVLPMFHSFMLTVCVFLPLTVGGSIVLIRSLHPPKAILEEILAREATVLPGIPQLFRALSHVPVPPRFSLRLCISGAAPLPLEVLRGFNRRFPIPLLEGYGLSEASPVVSVTPARGIQKQGSIGVPVPNVEVSIRNEEGQTLPVGETGEVCVRGGNVMRGYWNNPAETAKALRGGWLYTGDIGRMDADGYIYITDRKKDMLLVNGINVYPREIEEVIYQWPGVREAAVVGRKDARKGEQPVAFVAMVDGEKLDEPGLLGFLKMHLADYKIPRHVVHLPQLPRNATGKILKTQLRDSLAATGTGAGPSHPGKPTAV